MHVGVCMCVFSCVCFSPHFYENEALCICSNNFIASLVTSKKSFYADRAPPHILNFKSKENGKTVLFNKMARVKGRRGQEEGSYCRVDFIFFRILSVAPHATTVNVAPSPSLSILHRTVLPRENLLKIPGI